LIVAAAKETRLKLRLPIETILGTNFATKLEGVTRDGSVKNLVGSHSTDFAGGTLVAIYNVLTDGRLSLVTMYPEPDPTT